MGAGPGVDGGAPVVDDLDLILAAGESEGWLVSSWFLPLADPDQYLTLNGANVNEWAAAYGTFKSDMVAATPDTNVPQWDSTLYGSKGGLTFNGSTQFLVDDGLNVANWPTDAQDMMMLAAVRQDSAGATVGSTAAFAYGAGTNLSRIIGRTSVSSTNRTRINAGANAASGSVVDFSGSHTIGGIFDIGGNTTAYIDGAADGVVASATAALTQSRARIGASAAGTQNLFWNGAIVAVAILGPTATLTNFQDVESAMAGRLS